ncbi:chromate efflux transporter [Thalassotalea mangrovi]|uniref:Chromate efflux transporter n=1 Tax=Thalassotalea mangrovi TaxID=2572245 RepID=A0A4U1B7D0_9GAMM|nr:chromate efflux transporter [Thalassotalea mangrovi]TKB46383.1 chromate efflux transporter [Thalassotalea mangrovi]
MQVIEIFARFLLLGCYSFGGPVAHIGYFRHAFVEKLQWVDDKHYAQLISLTQFLPGPGSSQIGFAIGLERAGLLGGLAAFLGFTLPSFILLFVLSSMASQFEQNTLFQGITHGLKLFAVIVVSDAVLGMYNNFCKRRFHSGIAIICAAVLLSLPGLGMQLVVLVTAAAVGWLGKGWNPAIDNSTPLLVADNNSRLISWPLVIFIGLFIALPVLASTSLAWQTFASFYQSGALVFGGGHVVLPLLQQTLEGLISNDQFLTGYAAAQGVPGPMFTVATYLGVQINPEQSLLFAILATVAIFLPGFLLVIALKDAWLSLAHKPAVSASVDAINAAVVGLLIAALYQPVFISAVEGGVDMALVILGLFLMKKLKWPIIYLVMLFIAIGAGLSVVNIY